MKSLITSTTGVARWRRPSAFHSRARPPRNCIIIYFCIQGFLFLNLQKAKFRFRLFCSDVISLEKVLPPKIKAEKFELDMNKHVAKATGINRYVF